MGKAGRWLRHFLPGGRRGKDKPLASAPEPDQGTTTPASTPGAKEKLRWSFRRPAAGKEKAYGGFVEPHVNPEQHAVAVAIATAAAAEAVMAAKQAAFRMSASKRAVVVVGIEDAAAIKIQAVFRAYLARKALCALRGLVKLQALARGQLVRRQATHTLRCMQALVAVQHRARVARLRLLDDGSRKLRTPRTATPTRRSPHHPRLRHQETEENVKIVEVDTGGDAHATPRTTPLCRTPSKNEMLYQKKVSPTPSALTDGSARSLSGRYDDFSFATARNSPYHHYASSIGKQQQQRGHDDQHHYPLLVVPSYMANTESSRAKARSQSAPRQRHSVSATPTTPVMPPCWERQGSGRLLERRVQRCPSQASAPPCNWAARLDRWTASAKDSDCGSTGNAVTAATTTYCWSMATDNADIA